MAETPFACAAPAPAASSAADPGGFGTPPWGYYGPCARSSLTARVTSGHASADRSWANAERHSLEPQQGAERRAGPRHGPAIFGDPKIGPLARRTTGCGVPHQRLSALCSPLFSGSGKKTRGHPPPHQTGGRSVGFFAPPCFIQTKHGDSWLTKPAASASAKAWSSCRVEP